MADQEHVDKFILEEIDSVPHLEALLLLWRQHPKQWSVPEMAKALYVSDDLAEQILRDLSNRSLISAVAPQPGQYSISALSSETQQMLDSLDRTYRRELIRVTRMIHSKASPAIRDFARAFRFKKEEG
jgi:hypothetical protein